MLSMMTNTISTDETDRSLGEMTAKLRTQILDAQSLLEAGDIKGAEAHGKATLQLIKALEAQVKLEESQKDTRQKGVFYDADDIARARAELTRRLDRLAKTLRADEMGEVSE